MADETEPSFEVALTQIEQIVASLERGEPALSAALARYETGVKLLRHCYHLLEQAEQAVALLTGTDDQGNPLTTPFDATATLAGKSAAPTGPIGLEPRPISPDRSTPSGIRPAARDDRPDPSDPPF
jgi:exodeoxyribonuclease VII small subunit